MFEDLVSNLLSTYLGDYLEGLTKNDLKISLWKGDVELRHLQVRTEAFDFLNLPIQVKDGVVGKLTLKIPWKNLGKKPTKLFLDDVYLIACPKSELKFDEAKKKRREKESKRAQLKAIEENEQRYDEEMNAKQNNSSTAKLLAKIIDRFQLRINKIHIRFEDHSSCKDRSFCTGFLLEKLYVDSPHDEGEINDATPGIIDKKVKLSRFGIYWDSNESHMIPTSSIERLQQAMEVPFLKEIDSSLESFLPHHYILEPISLEFHIHIDLRKTELRKPSLDTVLEQTLQHLHWERSPSVKRMMACYTTVKQDGLRGRTKQEEWELFCSELLSADSADSSGFMQQASQFYETCWEIGNSPAPMVVIRGEMKEFLIKLQYQQYRDILDFLSNLSVQSLRAKYRRFKPALSNEEMKPRDWWRFAIQSVIAENQRRRENSGWNEYLRFKRRREEYMELYKRKNLSKNALKKDPKTLARIQKLEDYFSLENILLFRRIAMQEMAESAERKTKKKLKKSQLFEWDDLKRQELFSAFEIVPEDTSPWEGGQPTDIQIRLDFHLHKMGVYLMKENQKFLVCKLYEFSGRVFKRKEFLQLWCGVQRLCIEDAQQEYWSQFLFNQESSCGVSDFNGVGSQSGNGLYPGGVGSQSGNGLYLGEVGSQSGHGILPGRVESQSGNNLHPGEVTSNSSHNPHPEVTNATPIFLPSGTTKDQSVPIFLPSEMITDNTVPFLQLALETPSMKEDTDLSIRCTSLPLCIVGNLGTLLNTVDFFLSHLSDVNLYGLKRHTQNAIDLREWKKIQKMKVSKEIKSHKVRALDLSLGSIHLVLPGDFQQSVEQTQALVFRLGDVSIHSHPKRVSAEEIGEATIYDIIDVNISSMNVLMTNFQKDWMDLAIQQQQHLCLFDNFTIQGHVGISVAPSEIQYANYKVDVTVSMLHLSLCQQQYEGILQWVRCFVESMVRVMDGHQNHVHELKVVANQVVHRILEETKKDSIEVNEDMTTKRRLVGTSEEELRILQHNELLHVTTHFQGIRLCLCTSSHQDSIAELWVNNLSLWLKQRTFDLAMEVSLDSILIKDCQRSRLLNQPCYLLGSKRLLSNGQFESKEKELVKVAFTLLKKDSPDYATSHSTVSITVALGSLSFLVYRPTLYQLTHFFFSETPVPIAEGDGFHVSVYTISYIKYLTDKLLHRKQSLPTDWYHNQFSVSVSLHSASLLLYTDQLEPLYFATVDGVCGSVEMCPASVTVKVLLHEVSVLDCSRGAGKYRSILCIDDSTHQDLIQLRVTLYTDGRYPHFPGYQVAIEGTVRAPSIHLRVRCIDEIVNYLLTGPLWDTFQLLKQLKASRIDSKKPSVFASLYATALSFGKTMIVPREFNEQLPCILPFIDVVITNCLVSIPCSSTSSELLQFDLGQLILKNTPPVTIEEGDRSYVQVDSLKDTLNTLNLQLINMRFFSQSSSSSQVIMGGVSCSLVATVSQAIDVQVHLSKLSFALNEEQVSLLLKVIQGNLMEKAVCCPGTSQARKKTMPTTASQNSLPEKEIVFRKQINLTFVFDGVCAEFLLKHGGYSSHSTGEQMFMQVGTLDESFMYVDIHHLQSYIHIQGELISLGASLTSVSIHDSRAHSPVHIHYRKPLIFGGESKPAISLILCLHRRSAGEFNELRETGIPLERKITDLRLSVHVGHLIVRPTPWFFDALALGETVLKSIRSELEAISPLVSKHSHPKKTTRNLLPNMIIDVRMDNPYIYLIEDTSVGSSPAFLVSMSMDVTVSITPLSTLHASLSVLNIRGCRADPSSSRLPEPSMFDALYPFDVNSNFHIVKGSAFMGVIFPKGDASESLMGDGNGDPVRDLNESLMKDSVSDATRNTLDGSVKDQNENPMKDPLHINGTISTSTIRFRIGIKDIRLINNALTNLIPSNFLTRRKRDPLNSSTLSSNNLSIQFPHQVTFFVSIGKIDMILVDDTKDAEIPVLQLSIANTYSQVEMTSTVFKITANLSSMAEYYRPSLGVWEPLLEHWTLAFTLEREPRGKVIQRQLLSQDTESIMRIGITIPTMLNSNLSSSFLRVLLQTIHHFQTCQSTSRQQDNNYFISIANAFGL